MDRRLATHVQHAEQHCSEPDRGVGQRQKVGQVKLTDHREVCRRSSGRGGKIYAGFLGMSRTHNLCGPVYLVGLVCGAEGEKSATSRKQVCLVYSVYLVCLIYLVCGADGEKAETGEKRVSLVYPVN
jgi:hypothetical protein